MLSRTGDLQVRWLPSTIALANSSPDIINYPTPLFLESPLYIFKTFLHIMAEGLRSKTSHEPTKDEESQKAVKLTLCSMLTSVLKEQQHFIETQFAKFEDQ